MYTKESLIAFERKVADAFLAKQVRAPVHLSGGNEDQLLAIFKDVRPGDWVFSTWRSHYHALLKGIPEQWVWDEILAGRSMYLMNREHRFFSSAIVGGILPVACGVAMGIKRKAGERQSTCPECLGNGYTLIIYERPGGPPGNQKVECKTCTPQKVWVFVGDMTARTGLFHEFCQYVWGHDLPVRVIVEDNGLSTNTDTVAAWGYHCPDHPSVSLRYKYQRTYPHVGVGQHVQF